MDETFFMQPLQRLNFESIPIQSTGSTDNIVPCYSASVTFLNVTDLKIKSL